jgi:hypothetical protein
VWQGSSDAGIDESKDSSGTASRLVPLWQARRITVLVSRDILQEYLRELGKYRGIPILTVAGFLETTGL